MSAKHSCYRLAGRWRTLAALDPMPGCRRASTKDGLSPAELDGHGATRRTLRQVLATNDELAAPVRDLMVPDPGWRKPNEEEAQSKQARVPAANKRRMDR